MNVKMEGCMIDKDLTVSENKKERHALHEYDTGMYIIYSHSSSVASMASSCSSSF